MIAFGQPETRVALFGGQGAVRVEGLGAQLCPPFTAVIHCELSAGGRVGAHVQQSDEELVIVLAGGGEAMLDSVPLTLAPGSVLPVRLGQQLELAAAPETPLRYLIVKASA
jgi:uncharacterized cupin superfamily protein